MEKIIELSLQNLNTGNLWVAFLALAVLYILKKEPFKIYEYISKKRENEHNLAKELLESEKLTKEGNDFLREHLEYSAFKRYYGISADNEMRSALIKFHKKHQRDIKWIHIQRAFFNIKLNGAKIEAHLNLFDHIQRWLVTIVSITTGTYSIFMIGVAVIYSKDLALKQFLGYTTGALIILILSVYFATLNWPYHATKKIIELSKEN
ncbi:MAG: hypothetical protein IPI14_05820 [Polaromonas sp.]|nr:hypothetical protein [Polaromonas sp.]